jgi:hypothetical protein
MIRKGGAVPKAPPQRVFLRLLVRSRTRKRMMRTCLGGETLSGVGQTRSQTAKLIGKSLTLHRLYYFGKKRGCGMGLANLNLEESLFLCPLDWFARAFRSGPCYGLDLFAPVGAAIAAGKVCSLNDDLLACVPLVFRPKALGF